METGRVIKLNELRSFEEVKQIEALIKAYRDRVIEEYKSKKIDAEFASIKLWALQDYLGEGAVNTDIE